MQKIVDEQCKRSYLSDLHPNTTSQWNDLSLYEYSMNQARQLQIKESDIFDSILELKERLSNIGIEYNTGKIQIMEKYIPPNLKYNQKSGLFLMD